jgi:hypothetical protein
MQGNFGFKWSTLLRVEAWADGQNGTAMQGITHRFFGTGIRIQGTGYGVRGTGYGVQGTRMGDAIHHTSHL